MEKSSKRSRDERERHHRYRDSDRDDRHHHRRHRHRDREAKRERSYDDADSEVEESRERERAKRERSYDDGDEDRRERGKSRERDRAKRERSYDDGDEEDRREMARSRERERAKRERSYDDSDEEDRRERARSRERERVKRERSYDDADGDREREKRVRISEDVGNGELKREKRRFEDRRVKEEEVEGYGGEEEDNGQVKVKKEVSEEKGASLESLSTASRNVSENSSIHPTPTKVSSISTKNENKGVNITGSHEVPGKSSTDGSSTSAAKSGSLSLDALAKAKKALQMQKELAEKLKKIPALNKGAAPTSDGKGAPKLQPSTAGISQSASSSATDSSGVPAGNAASMKPTVGGVPGVGSIANTASLEAVRRAQELAAKMGFRQDPQFAPLINLFPGQMPQEVSAAPKPTKAPVLRLDALGREIDEHGNVVNVMKPSNISTLKVNINKQKKDSFQILKPELEVDPEKNPHFDARMGINKNKLLRPKRMSFQFVEEGRWSKEAETIKLKNQFGEARAKEQKAKQAQLAKAKAAPDINPNLIEVGARVVTKEKTKDPIPEVEWWDVPLLRPGTYGEIMDGFIPEDNIKVEKITIYVEHPRPIEPPAEPAPPPPQPLKLTKKEQKKLRTQRRLAREKEKQEMIRQGLVEPPKPKVKLSNLMKVLGSEATQDPTRIEKEIRSAAAEREQAHIDRNIARKLTPAERREKKERKLFDDPSAVETIVSVYKINDLSHPQTRFKVDVNAQENRLTGCAVICDGISVVVVEGGNKSIKRYGKLMLRRINWAAAVKEEEENEDDDDKPVNKCVLVWQGSVAKPTFHRFSVHECITDAAARKIFSDAGVGHYWDLAVNFTEE